MSSYLVGKVTSTPQIFSFNSITWGLLKGVSPNTRQYKVIPSAQISRGRPCKENKLQKDTAMFLKCAVPLQLVRQKSVIKKIECYRHLKINPTCIAFKLTNEKHTLSMFTVDHEEATDKICNSGKPSNFIAYLTYTNMLIISSFSASITSSDIVFSVFGN